MLKTAEMGEFHIKICFEVFLGYQKSNFSTVSTVILHHLCVLLHLINIGVEALALSVILTLFISHCYPSLSEHFTLSDGALVKFQY